MKHLLKAQEHFFNTMATKELANEVLEKVKTAEVEQGKIIVFYSSEGMCIFDVLVDNENLRHVEFISTAS